KITFYEGETFEVIEKNGQSLVIYRDVDRLEAELLAKAPEDTGGIKEFTGLIRKLSHFKIPGGDSFFSRLFSYIKAIPHFAALGKYSKLTMGDFAKKFKNPLLKEFFGAGLNELSFIAIVFSLAWMTTGNAGYPIGGSPKLIGLIWDRYTSLGGKIRFGTKVKKIIVQNGRACGVLLDNGEQLSTDIVVSAADGHATIFEMLEGKYVSDKIADTYRTYKLFPSYVQVSLGIAADLKNEPDYLYTDLNHEIEIDPQTRISALAMRIFHFDPTFAPTGKTAVTILIVTTDDEYWTSLRDNDRPRYEAEKNRIAREITATFEQRFPAAKDKIEVIDVATPATVLRYTGNWRGSMEGWLMTPTTGIRTLPAVLPGLKDFYMVGQWISPGGGLPSGLLTARDVSKTICRDNHLPWNPS
ncbi:MAG TPA: NAD(P)/FAD-dependent oxidoreductase, partial [Candidatus Deferrimicrobium sp.]|nr:NAD(P)/FAD-dependent oxidoreductase [Candidatus Deferrimicrobium sp.]